MQKIAITDSITHLIQGVNYVKSQSQLHPKMLLLFGPPGVGKTIALKYLESQYGGIYYAATPGLSLTSLANELIEKMTGDVVHLRLAHAKYELFNLVKNRNLPIAIDEAGFLNFNCLEFLRSLHDACDVPVIFAGMSDLYVRMLDNPQLLDRMTCIPCKKCDKSDAKFLAQAITTIEIAEDLLYDCHHKLDGNLRKMSTAIALFEERAIELGKTHLSMKDWGKEPYLSSHHQPPIRK